MGNEKSNAWGQGMEAERLLEILRLHIRYVRGLPGGVRADLRRADLSHRDMAGVELTRALLTGANFAGTILTGADFSAADLFCANFENADARTLCSMAPICAGPGFAAPFSPAPA